MYGEEPTSILSPVPSLDPDPGPLTSLRLSLDFTPEALIVHELDMAQAQAQYAHKTLQEPLA